MPSKTAKAKIQRKSTRTAADPQAGPRSNTVEAHRLAAKDAVIRAYLADARKREAELTRQGYAF